MMALVFIFPENKPPFFGIKFDSETEAERTNKFFPRMKSGWNAKIEVEGVRINVTIKSIAGNDKHTYTLYSWDKEALKVFLKAAKTTNEVSFGHVTETGKDQYKIAYWSSLGRRWWIKVSRIEYSVI